MTIAWRGNANVNRILADSTRRLMYARSDSQILESQLVKGCWALENTWAREEFQ